MCIIFIAKNVHPDHPLIIAANRDEYFDRPTQPPHWWVDAPHIFAGKDLQAGGTWLGYNRQNRIAGITNLRRPDLYQEGAKSRGELVKRFLDIDSASTESAISDFTAFLQASYSQYNPFNLLFGDASKLVIFSSATGIAQEVSDGVHGLSNGVPDDTWPKMSLGVTKLSEYLVPNNTFDPEDLFFILNDKTLINKALLPKTDIPLDNEYLLSSIYIPEFSLNGSAYGTRSSSVIWFSSRFLNGGAFMQSRSYSSMNQ